MSLDEAGRQQEYQSVMDQGYQTRDEGDATLALQFFQRAVTLALDDGEKADAVSMVGRCYGTIGDFGSAEAALTEALRLAANLPPVLARVKVQVGTVRWQQGQLDAAKQFLAQSAAELRRLGGDQSTRLRALGNLGLVLHTRGEYQEAIAALKTALEVAESLNNWFSVSIQLNNMGEAYQDLGDLAKARELHERALNVARERGLGEGAQIDLLRNLGVDLLGLDEFDRGLDIIQQSLAMARTFHRMETELQCLASLGEAYLICGECDKAEQVARQLVEASANVANRLAGARLILGRCWLARNDTLQALTILEAGLIDAQASYSKMMILRLHAALSQVVSHPAIAQVHRRIAAELVQQIADSLDDRALRNTFLQSPLARSVL